jgi:hypothetical protein
MEEQLQTFDICILCALYEEASSLIDEFATRCNVTFTKAFRGLNRLEYRHAVIQNQRGESLTIFVTWLSDIGPIRTALDIKPLLQEVSPRFVAMTGLWNSPDFGESWKRNMRDEKQEGSPYGIVHQARYHLQKHLALGLKPSHR